MSIRITRCICVNRTLEDLLEQAQAENLNVDQLMQESGAGNGCRLCRPYLKQAIETGQTEFDQILIDTERV
mgnify:CR=1 FL=1